MKFRTPLIIGAVALGSLLVACGDDSKGGGGGSALSDADFCDMIRSFMTATDELGNSYAADDPTATKDAFEQMQDMVAALDAAAPASIKADVHTMRLAIDDMVGVMAKYDYDIMTLATAPEAEDFASIGDSEEMNAASARLDTYQTDVCNIPLES